MKRTASILLAATVASTIAGCGPTYTTTAKSYTASGQLSDATVDQNGRVISEIRRIFEGTIQTGEGVFENSNEGLARQAALSLAQADLAQKVQTEVRGNTIIMNNKDARSVVETNVHALISNYQIDSAVYEPGSPTKYRVRISVRGEQLVREIERRLNR